MEIPCWRYKGLDLGQRRLNFSEGFLWNVWPSTFPSQIQRSISCTKLLLLMFGLWSSCFSFKKQCLSMVKNSHHPMVNKLLHSLKWRNIWRMDGGTPQEEANHWVWIYRQVSYLIFHGSAWILFFFFPLPATHYSCCILFVFTPDPFSSHNNLCLNLEILFYFQLGR